MLAECRRLQRVVTMGLDRGDIDRVDRGMIEEYIELIEARHAELGGKRSCRSALRFHTPITAAWNLSPAGLLNSAASAPSRSDSDHRASQEHRRTGAAIDQ